MSDLRRHLPSAAFVVLVLLVIAAIGAIFILSGVYNIGADAPHSRIAYAALEEFRDRAIARGSRDINAPGDLGDPKRVAAGAGLYQEMCTGCHLGPGIEPSELSQGLYPEAPDLAQTDLSPAEQFWTIKHGVKLTAMPAWGKTHSDELIWDMVAFIRQLPRMTPAHYKALIASAPEDHEEMMKEMQGSQAHNTASQPHSHAPSSPAQDHH